MEPVEYVLCTVVAGVLLALILGGWRICGHAIVAAYKWHKERRTLWEYHPPKIGEMEFIRIKAPLYKRLGLQPPKWLNAKLKQ